MNKILLLLFAVALIAAGCDSSLGATPEVSFPEPTGYVVDNAGLLKPDSIASLSKDLESFDKAGKGQISVVIVKSTYPLELEDYSIKLAEKFKVGHKGSDDGIIFLLASSDRKVRIEVGKGLEGKINDAKAGRILDDTVIPFLKKNDWGGGIKAGVKAIEENLK